ncbi:hypothetical protein [Thiobaca trueperi]|uniref:hypothetical protein n=1 Tax=Thiobaca trueperi TaxID=127458 RepID=UPI0014044206|nr:hypothetical protein [Thiobaca trueperi]
MFDLNCQDSIPRQRAHANWSINHEQRRRQKEGNEESAAEKHEREKGREKGQKRESEIKRALP